MFLNLEEFDDVEYASTVKCDDEKWTMVEKGDWVSSGEYEYQTCVVMNNESGKYYKYELSRSRGYYSDYYYYTHIEDDKSVELSEVIPIEKTIVVKSWEYV